MLVQMKEIHNNIYIALGSNLRSYSHKNVKVFFNAIIFRLELLGLKLKRKSSIWITNPIPFSSGPNFFNNVVEFTYKCNNSPCSEDAVGQIDSYKLLGDQLGTCKWNCKTEKLCTNLNTKGKFI